MGFLWLTGTEDEGVCEDTRHDGQRDGGAEQRVVDCAVVEEVVHREDHHQEVRLPRFPVQGITQERDDISPCARA